ncbi:catenin alpha [Biomphalaria glabrata]|nr:catenin alpha [Biomphalaria glabrata]
MVTAEQKKVKKKSQWQEDELKDLNPNLVNCASKIMSEAVQKFVAESEKHSKKSQNQEFIKRVSAANENLTVTIDQLLIMAHRFESGNPSENMKQTLCQSAKDVLQGVIKVLLVVDDFYVQGLLNKTDAVITAIKSINIAQDYTETKKKLAYLAVSVMSLRALLFKRCQNLCSKACSDQLIIWGNVLQSSMRVLHQVTKTCSQYPSNISAKASYDSVEQEMIQACHKIKVLLTSGPEDSIDDTIISFVSIVDQLMDMLTEAQQGDLHEDAESNIVTLVQHSMSVAHCCTTGVYREMIMASCHRILQLKFRLTELHDTIKTKPVIPHMRNEFTKLCETTLDEICDLEKHVTMTLVQVIIEMFICPKEKMIKLRKVAFVQNSSAEYSSAHKKHIQEFIEYTEQFCQVALLVAASSTDNAKVREIVTAVKCLESIEVELEPAVLMNCKDPKNRASNKHLELILGRWSREVKTVMDSIDKLVDPRVFMDMTENLLSKEVENFATMEGASHSELLNHNYRIRNLVNRPMVLAEKLVDESSDPIYRNGLRCFIKTLTESMSDADSVYMELLQTREPTHQQHDTVDRRLKIVLQALKNLREGLDVNKHPHIMSKERLMFHSRGTELSDKLQQARKDLKLEEKESRVKLINSAQTQSKGVNTDKDHEQIPKEETRQQIQTAEAFTETVEVEKLSSVKLDSALEKQSSSVKLDSAGTTKLVDESLVTLPEVFKEKEREGGAAAELYGLVKTLLIASISKDQKSVQDLTHSLLSWTNHIVENAEAIISHCPIILNRSELVQISQELDKTSTEVILRAKFVVAGDMSLVKELLVTSVLWAQQLTRARLITDVAADKFITMTSALCEYVQHGPERDRNLQMEAIIAVHKELSSLLTCAKEITAQYLDHGNEKMEYLTQSQNELENLTATIQTTVDVAAVSAIKIANDWWQFRMACHDWSVLMTCVLTECEDLSLKLEALGQVKFTGLQNSPVRDALKTCNIMERETNFLLELVDCVIIGDITLKERSEPLVSELQAALRSAWSVSRKPVNKSDVPLQALFDKLRFRLMHSIWIEKALNVKLFIRNNCFNHMGFTRQILLDAQNVLVTEDFSKEESVKKRYILASHLLDQSNEFKQKVFKCLQLSSDLIKRAVIRSTLDDLAKLTSEIDRLLREKPKISDADVDFYSEQWGGKVKKLLANLKKMDGIRLSAVSDLENFTNRIANGGVETNNKNESNQLLQPVSYSLAGQHNHFVSSIQNPLHMQQLPLQMQQPPLQMQEASKHMQQSLLQSSAVNTHQQLLPLSLRQSQFYQPVPLILEQHVSPQFVVSQPNENQQIIPQLHGPAALHPPHYLSLQHSYQQQPLSISGSQPHILTKDVETPKKAAPLLSVSRALRPQPSQPLSNQQFQGTNLSLNPHHSMGTASSYTNKHALPQTSTSVSSSVLQPDLTHASSQHPDIQSREESEMNTSSPVGKSVSVLLKDAQYLGIRLYKWQENMAHLDGHERSAVVHDALQMARLCSEMALFTKGQGPYKGSSEVVSAAISVVKYSKKIETFANRLHSLTGHCWLADHLKMCILKMNGCSSQLHIIATALHNSPKSHQGDRILVRNASNLLSTVRQMFALLESIAAMGITEPSVTDELTKEIISLLAQIRLDNESYLREERKSSQIDELGLRRVELHNPPSLTSLLEINDAE